MKRIQREMLLRCMAFKEKEHYTAVCLSLSLASRGDTIAEAMDNLDAQINDYLAEVKSEPQFAVQLLNRPSPLSLWVKYYFIKFMSVWRGKTKDVSFYEGACSA